MMTMKNILKYSIVLLASTLVLPGCQTESERMDEHHFDNKLYLNASASTDEILVKQTGSRVDVTRSLTIGTALEAECDITAKLVAAPELLDTYKQAYYDETANILPSEMCEISDPVMKITKGANVSPEVSITFTNLDQLDRELVYVMPVKLTDIQGIDPLDSKTTVYYVFKGAALINVVADLAENRAYPDWKDGSIVDNMSNFTLECLVNFNKFGRQISTIMGIEGNFLLRVGDAGVPDNQLQVAASRNLTSSDLQFETGRWYHIAMTFDNGNVKVYFDGVEKLSGNCGKTSVSLGAAHTDTEASSPCFWIGYSYASDRYLDGKIAEVRIWNKTLSVDEINAPTHFYTVDPASDGLVAYWKFDEGAGNKIKDYSVNGNDLTVDSVPGWTKVSLP